MLHNLLIWVVYLPATLFFSVLALTVPSLCDWIQKVWGGLV